MVSPVPNAVIGGARGRESSGSRALHHAETLYPVIMRECEQHSDPAALTVEWLTERLTELGWKSPRGDALTTTSVRRLLRRVNRTMRGIRSHLLMDKIAAMKAANASDQDGVLAAARQHNRNRIIERAWEVTELAEEDVILHHETEDTINLMARDRERKGKQTKPR